MPEAALKEYDGKFPETPYTGDNRYLPHRTPRAAYAAMITYLDAQVGRILDTLKEIGVDERTLVMFTSDNGATFDIGGAPTRFFESNGALRGHKTNLYEGGIRVPLIARWPGRIRAGDDVGSHRRELGHVGDVCRARRRRAAGRDGRHLNRARPSLDVGRSASTRRCTGSSTRRGARRQCDVETILMGTISLLVWPFDRNGEMQHGCARWWCRMVAVTIGARIHVHGVEQVQAGRSYVYVANHSSLIDTPALFTMLALPVEDHGEAVAVLRAVCRMAPVEFGNFPINRGGAAAKAY